MGLVLVLNIHGKIDSPAPVRKALTELNVERRFSATVVTDDTATIGTLKLCKDYVAWSPLDVELLVTLLKKRGMVSTTSKLDSAALSVLGFQKYKDLAEKIVKEELRLSEIEGVRPFFRLAPPVGGFRASLRRQFSEKGVMGSNPHLPDLVRRMI